MVDVEATYVTPHTDRLKETADETTDSIFDTIRTRLDDATARAAPRIAGGLIGASFIMTRVAAQAQLCQEGNFFDRAFSFALTAAATFLVGGFIASQLFGGGGQAIALDSEKQSMFKSMQMGGIWGIIGAFAGLALLSIVIAWVVVPVDMSCFSGFGFGG